MVNAINTKILISILISILALLTAIGGRLAYQHAESKRAADAAARTAAILKRQQDDAQAHKDREAPLWKQVEQNKKKQSSLNKGSKVWQTYLP
jgi:hypothetical protein